MHRNRLGTSGGVHNLGIGNNNHGSTSDDDDLYSGYNDFPSALNTDDLEFDENFQNSARSMESRRPTALGTRGLTSGGGGFGGGTRLGTAAGFKRDSISRTGIFTRGGTGRPITGAGGDSGGLNRPMTAVRGAGYTTAAKGQHPFDPINSASSRKLTPSLEPKPEDTVDEKVKLLEEKINKLIEESVLLGCKGDSKKALDLARDASNKEKSLMKLKEQSGTNEGHDWDLTFSVMFNLATQFEACEMYTEALTTYQSIAKNKFLIHGPKVKINMGNIYFKQGNPTKAIKMYRMAMDQLSNTNKDLRLKLMHNMGIIFLKIDHPTDAANSFEFIMQEKPSFKTGLHLVVANFMAGDPDKMKRSFQDLLEVPMEFDDDEDKYTTVSDDPVSQLLVEVLKNDKLRKFEKEQKLYAERCVLSAARLIAPTIEGTLSDGYNWVTEEIKASKHSQLAHALEISKALVFLKQRELGEAAEILKSFEKKETKVATAAATNLSFMFFLQGDFDQALKYGEMATKADFYNSVAYVNLGNCHYIRGELEEAKKMYSEALTIDASCTEALYNLGLVNQNLKFYEEALECFHKVQSLVRNHPHVAYQLGCTHELRMETEVAVEWYLKALALVPTDPGILKKLGQIADMEGDRQQAYQHYFDCNKYDPSDIDVILWLGAYLMDMQLHEKALLFYQKGQLLQPEEPRWTVLIGNVYRGMGNLSMALQTFLKLYRENPESLEALRGLVRISGEMGLSESETYKAELQRVERALENSATSGRKSKASSGSGASRFGPPSRMGSSRPNTTNAHQNSSFEDSSERGDYYASHSPRNAREVYDRGYMNEQGDTGNGRSGDLSDIEDDDALDELGMDIQSSRRGSGLHRQMAASSIRTARPGTANDEAMRAMIMEAAAATHELFDFD